DLRGAFLHPACRGQLVPLWRATGAAAMDRDHSGVGGRADDLDAGTRRLRRDDRPGDMTIDARHTFVVPAFGRSPHLRECLASLQAQTRPSPVVVTTPAPYEGLDTLAADYGARLVVNPQGGGIGRDWNFALEQAQTP